MGCETAWGIPRISRRATASHTSRQRNKNSVSTQETKIYCGICWKEDRHFREIRRRAVSQRGEVYKRDSSFLEKRNFTVARDNRIFGRKIAIASSHYFLTLLKKKLLMLLEKFYLFIWKKKYNFLHISSFFYFIGSDKYEDFFFAFIYFDLQNENLTTRAVARLSGGNNPVFSTK